MYCVVRIDYSKVRLQIALRYVSVTQTACKGNHKWRGCHSRPLAFRRNRGFRSLSEIRGVEQNLWTAYLIFMFNNILNQKFLFLKFK